MILLPPDGKRERNRSYCIYVHFIHDFLYSGFFRTKCLKINYKMCVHILLIEGNMQSSFINNTLTSLTKISIKY